MQANSISYIDPIAPSPAFTNINQVGLTPPQIATAYNIPASTGANVKIGIISLGGGWSTADLNNSMSDLGITFNASAAVTTVLVDGATGTYTGAGADAENTLDLYCVAGMAPAANIVIYIGQNNSINYTTNPSGAALLNRNTSFGNLINRAVNEECDVITVSWGIGEAFSDQFPNFYCGDYLAGPLANAAAKGITVLVSAGDYGSYSSVAGNLVTPSYPATNANVVAVGGTNLQLTAGNLRLSETVEWHDPGFGTDFGSGGGISTFVTQPSWQSGLTYRKYFSGNSVTSAPITLTTRGIPDISGPMNAYGLWFNGSITGFGGTSASAPIMAGMLARFMSMNGGRRPIPNAIHPILYGNLNAYYDILTGNNATVAYANGYAASSNWDPITGVGIPWGNVVYPMVSSGGTVVKTDTNTWSYLANVKVKTATDTWSNVKAIWTKTVSGWKQTF
jgi:kumamolisin